MVLKSTEIVAKWGHLLGARGTGGDSKEQIDCIALLCLESAGGYSESMCGSPTWEGSQGSHVSQVLRNPLWAWRVRLAHRAALQLPRTRVVPLVGMHSALRLPLLQGLTWVPGRGCLFSA